MSTQATVYANEHRRPVTKTFSLINGQLEIKTAASASCGKFRVIDIEGLEGLREFFIRAHHHQALIFGVPELKQGVLLSAARMVEYCGVEPAIQRNKQFFRYSEGRAFMLLDHDPTPGANPLGENELVQLLRDTVPELAGVRLLSRPSASSFIYHGDEMLRGAGGWHLYCEVDQGSLIPAAAKLIEARLWVAGYGRIEITTAGTTLTKTLIDMAVYNAPHFDFIKGKCRAPLWQRNQAPQIHEPTTPGDGVWRLAETLGFAP